MTVNEQCAWNRRVADLNINLFRWFIFDNFICVECVRPMRAIKLLWQCCKEIFRLHLFHYVSYSTSAIIRILNTAYSTLCLQDNLKNRKQFLRRQKAQQLNRFYNTQRSICVMTKWLLVFEPKMCEKMFDVEMVGCLCLSMLFETISIFNFHSSLFVANFRRVWEDTKSVLILQQQHFLIQFLLVSS